MAFDLIEQDFSTSAEAGYTFELVLPNGVSSGAHLTILGDLSKTVRDYSKRKYQEFQTRNQVAKRKGKEPDDISLDEAEDMAVEAALVRLIGWNGFIEKKKDVPFTKEKAAEVLRKHGWIRDAIITEAGDVTNFTPKASNS